MTQISINLWAVLGSGVASMVVGGLWYSPVLFGKTWMHLMGFTAETMQKQKSKAMRGYVVAFLASLVMSYVLAHFLTYAMTYSHSFGVKAGLMGGFWLWLGFFFPVTLGSFLWENKPFKLFLINVSHYLASLLVMSAILAKWM